MSLALERLEELRAANLPSVTIDDLHERIQARITDALRDEVAEYLGRFVVADSCPCCHGWGTFTWGLVHGQGKCVSCGWPATAYHFVGEGESAFQFQAILWAHPSDVRTRGEGTGFG